MVRLPTPGGDAGDWGDILNDFLEVSHANDGTLNSNVAGTAQIKNGAVTNAKLDSSTQTSLSKADSSVQTVNSQAPIAGDITLTKSDVGLGDVDNTSDANKPVSTATQTALNAKLTASSNLSDLGSASTARTNLGLGTAAVSDSTAFEPAGLSSGTLTTLDSRYQALLSDTGSLQQWLANTPANKGSIWAYQGVVYARLTTGTDSSFTRANWVELGADPTTIGGGELAAAILTTTQIFACTSTYADVPGLAVAPVIPSNGRGIYVDFDVTSNSNVNAVSVQYRLYDVTADQAVPGVLKIYCATTSGTYNGFRRWRLTPAAGNQTYKIQVNISSNGNVGTYGTDYGVATGLFTTSR